MYNQIIHGLEKEGGQLIMNSKLARVFLSVALLVGGLACRAVMQGVESMTNVQRGSGPVVSEERDVSGFNRLAHSSLGNVEIELGEVDALTVEAEENLLPFIVTEVQGDTLVIGTQPGVNIIPQEPIRYHLTVVSLEGISVSGLGDVNVPAVQADSFEVEISGAGSVDIASLVADDLRVEISGLGDLSIEGGQVSEQRVEISGSGSYRARELDSERARVSIPGLGQATLRVSEHLDAEVSGSGSVFYLGDPEVDSDISGLGKVERLDD
jgi:hypothetical protein